MTAATRYLLRVTLACTLPHAPQVECCTSDRNLQVRVATEGMRWHAPADVLQHTLAPPGQRQRQQQQHRGSALVPPPPWAGGVLPPWAGGTQTKENSRLAAWGVAEPPKGPGTVPGAAGPVGLACVLAPPLPLPPVEPAGAGPYRWAPPVHGWAAPHEIAGGQLPPGFR
jgi:hypothetical protein